VDYPRIMQMSTSDLPFKVAHLTEPVASNLEKGTLALTRMVDLKVAWHDPCNLGRMSEPWIHWEGTRGEWGCLEPKEGYAPKEFRRGTTGVYEGPRNILGNIQGLELVELPRNYENSWCCGGHGGVPEAYPDLMAHAVGERLDEVKKVGAEALVSGCPYCKETFQSGLEGRQDKVQIFDISEIIAEAL